MRRIGSGRGEWPLILFFWGVALGVAACFLWIVSDLLLHGAGRISRDFLTLPPADAGRAGGISSVLVATGLILAVCLAVVLPVGLGTAVLLAEFGRAEGRFSRLVRQSLEVLAGVPSIVFGLFGAAFFCEVLGLGFSIAAGGLTLACMVLPILIRIAEEGLRAVPREYRMAAAALGLSRTAILFHVLLPAAFPALMVGVVLGIGRALAETAALIFTSGYVDRMPASLLDSGRALSVHIYDLAMNVPGGDETAYASALVLITLLLVINSAAAGMNRRWLKGRVSAP